jgi:hypothetical protein
MVTLRSYILTCVLTLILAGCVGSPVHSTMTYSSIQSTIKKNNQGLMDLRVGMAQPEVRSTLGDPERSEGYEWGSAWLYRTAMTSGIYGTADADFTPVVFDSSETLVGWGRNFFTEHVRRYDLRIRHE